MPESDDENSWLPAEYEPGLASVLVTTWNRAELVPYTLESAFRQSWRPLEVVVADDGSTDNTLEVLKAISPPDDVVYRVVEGEHLGSCPTRNRAAQASRGEYLMFLDSDDLLTEPAIEQLVTTLRDNQADVSCGLWRDMKTGPDACTLAEPEQRRMDEDWLVSLLRNQWLATCALLFRRESVCAVDEWHEECALDGDFDFSARVAATGAKLAMFPQVVACYRRHGEQISAHHHATKHGHTRLILKRLEAILEADNAWTQERRSALAWRYYWTARMTWLYTDDAGEFERLMREAKRIDPGFAPPKSWYRWIGSLAGYRTAERVAAIGRKLFR